MNTPDYKQIIPLVPSPLFIPYFTFFSTPEMMSAEQASFYSEWLNAINTGIFWDIEGNLGYVFLYMSQISAEKSLDEIINLLHVVKAVYGEYSKIDEYCNGYIASAYILKNRFDLALQYLPNNFNLLKNAGVEIDLSVVIRLYPPSLAATTHFGRANRDKIIAEIPAIFQEYEEQTEINVIQDCIKVIPDFNYYLFRDTTQEFDKDTFRKKSPYYSFDSRKFWEIIPDIIRIAEDRVRVKFGLPMIGEGWLGETRLFHEIKATFPACKVTNHTRLPFLGQQHLDVYIHELRLGLEYQGEQHERSLDYFGGESEFAQTQERDARKQLLCEQEGIALFYVYPGYSYDALVAQIMEVARQRGIAISKNYLKENDRIQIQNRLDAKYLRDKPLNSINIESENVNPQERLTNWLNDHKSRLREHNLKEIRAYAQEREMNLASSTDPLDRHYFLEKLSYWHYRYKEYSGFIEKSIEYGLQDIALIQNCLDSFDRGQFESLQYEYRTTFGHNPLPMSDKRRMLLNSFGRVFVRLIDTYEKLGQIDQAIDICRKAIEMGIIDSQSKGGFPKRLEKLMSNKG